MGQRFQLEDLLAQDSSGVSFRVRDATTGQPFFLRRYFPFGPQGGGLNAEEQVAYQQAVDHLTGLDFPHLCRVVDGGCDAIDGLPYLVTEPGEGDLLGHVLDQGKLSPAHAHQLLSQAIDTCQSLAIALGHHAVWIDTGLSMISLGSHASFTPAPLKWLGKNDGQRGLEPLLSLAQAVIPPGHLALGRWLNWLRSAARTATFQQAQDQLAATQAPISLAPPPPRPLGAKPAARKKKRPSEAPQVIAACLALTVTAFGGWALIRHRASTLTPSQKTAALPPRIAKNPAASLQPHGIFTIADHAALIAQAKQEVILEGNLTELKPSKSGATLHLHFSKVPTTSEACGAIRLKSAPDDLTASALAPLLGKKIRLHGKVHFEKINDRPVISIKSRDAIEVVE